MKTVLDQTRLSVERTRLSFVRTLMSEIRTATSLITFGFAVYKFFQIENPVPGGRNYVVGPREFGMLMIVIGLATLTLGIAEYMRDMRVLRAAYPDLPRSNVGYVTALVAALGTLGLIMIVLRR
ncbi:MAG TPA: DUF202 domain-containing protein [Sphingomicrobium sp.]|nr:DUF202 domain-containing protein [Sphingomicrobium sp.]